MPKQFTKNTKVKTEGLDKRIRLFAKVMRDEKLTLLQKFIICDVISFQIQGMTYFKTSAQLAKELGNYTPKTIQSAFQFLNDNGYLNCFPYESEKNSDYDLREARVIQIEKWIYNDEHLKSINFIELPIEKKGYDHPTKMAWRNRHKKKEGSQTENQKEVSEITINTLDLPIEQEEPKVETAIDINKFLTPIRLEIVKKMATKEGISQDEIIYELHQAEIQQVKEFFNFKEGVYYYSISDNKNEDHWENEFGIHYHYAGIGSRCVFKLYDEEGKPSERIELNINDLENYYIETEKSFKDLTLDNYETIKQYRKQPLSVY